jgi:hypothetical protein
MKTAFLIVLSLVSAGTVWCADYSPRIRHVIAQLKEERFSADGLPLVEGINSAPGSRNGTYFLLFPYILATATKDDVLLMLKDKSPIIRIAGAKRVLTDYYSPLPVSALDVLAKDEEKVRAGPTCPYGEYEIMSVASVVLALQKDPKFLFEYCEEETKPKPNQALEPTTTAVTDRAAHAPRQP